MKTLSIKNYFTFLYGIALLVFCNINIYAQAPQAIPYQAVARDNAGNLIANQNISLRFSIHDATAGGTVVYQETQNKTTNSLGLFTANIGEGAVVNGTFALIDWGSSSKFVQVELDALGGIAYTDVGTQQMLSVPYALYAINGLMPGSANGEMLYWNGNGWVIIAPGTNNQNLTFCNGIPTWGPCPLLQLPTLTTLQISAIGVSTATSGGMVSNDGGVAITAKGVCWSTSPNPTISNDFTSNGGGTGTFTSNVTGLTMGTTYYLRAYATNSVGTAYGNQESFTTQTPFITSDTVVICSQVWMLKNLDVDHYRNGDPIPNVTDPNQWIGLTTGAYCYYDNDSTTYAAIYGKLYNWFAVNDPRGLAPNGWHVPSDVEFTTLENCIGGNENNVGNSLKETGTAHWPAPNNTATNSSGFTALPSGIRFGNTGGFIFINSVTYWWSSTEIDSDNAWIRTLPEGDASFFSQYGWKQYGYSVRCLRD